VAKFSAIAPLYQFSKFHLQILVGAVSPMELLREREPPLQIIICNLVFRQENFDGSKTLKI